MDRDFYRTASGSRQTSSRDAPRDYDRRDRENREIYGSRRDFGPERNRDRDRDRDQDRDRGREVVRTEAFRTFVPGGSEMSPATSRRDSTATTDSPKDAGDVLGAIRKFGDALVQRTSLAFEQDGYEKIMQQKKAEFEKSKSKHADFPSVAELESVWRRRYHGKLEGVNKKLQENRQDYDKATIALTASLVQAAASKSASASIQPSSEPRQAFSAFKKELLQAQERSLELFRKETNASTLEKLSDLQRQNANLAAEVKTLRRQLEENNAAWDSLKTGNDESKAVLEEVKQQVAGCDLQLSRLDFEMLDKVSDALSFDLPALKRTSEAQSTELDLLKAEHIRTVSHATVKASSSEMRQDGNHGIEPPVAAGSQAMTQARLEALQSKLDDHDIQLRKQDDKACELTAALRQGAAQVDMSLVKKSLAQDEARLSTVEGSVQDVYRRLEASQLALQNLDSQYNNISTRSVADVVVGHMEQLYPANRQIVNQLTELRTDSSRRDQQLTSMDHRLVAVESALGVSNGQPALNGSHNANGDAQGDNFAAAHAAKRRRV